MAVLCVLQTSPVLACRAYTDGIQAVRGSVGELQPSGCECCLSLIPVVVYCITCFRVAACVLLLLCVCMYLISCLVNRKLKINMQSLVLVPCRAISAAAATHGSKLYLMHMVTNCLHVNHDGLHHTVPVHSRFDTPQDGVTCGLGQSMLT